MKKRIIYSVVAVFALNPAVYAQEAIEIEIDPQGSRIDFDWVLVWYCVAVMRLTTPGEVSRDRLSQATQIRVVPVPVPVPVPELTPARATAARRLSRPDSDPQSGSKHRPVKQR